MKKVLFIYEIPSLNSWDTNGTCANCWTNFTLTESPQKPQQIHTHSQTHTKVMREESM